MRVLPDLDDDLVVREVFAITDGIQAVERSAVPHEAHVGGYSPLPLVNQLID